MTRERLAEDHRVVIRGGHPAHGVVQVEGFKHALVTATAAAVLGDSDVEIVNVPTINETAALGELLSRLGGQVAVEAGRMRVNCSGLDSWVMDDGVASTIHGSVYLVPGLVARGGRAVFPSSGGCRIGEGTAGDRPIEQYLDVMGRFGVQAKRTTRTLTLHAPRLVATEIDLADYTDDRTELTGPLYSGATKAAVLTAALAHGTSTIHHPYPKPDVTELVAVLQAMGCEIEVEPERLRITGTGGTPLTRPVRHVLCADLIEVVTWLALAAVAAPQGVTVVGQGLAAALRGLGPELEVLDRLGVEVTGDEQAITVARPDEVRPVDVVVRSRGIYSDSHPLLALVAARAGGRSTFRETVWTRRFGYVDQLQRLGVRATVASSTVQLHGPWQPAAGDRLLTATDLRAAATLCLAATVTPGRTEIVGGHHLARGYRDLAGTLRHLGVRAETVRHLADVS